MEFAHERIETQNAMKSRFKDQMDQENELKNEILHHISSNQRNRKSADNSFLKNAMQAIENVLNSEQNSLHFCLKKKKIQTINMMEN